MIHSISRLGTLGDESWQFFAHVTYFRLLLMENANFNLPSTPVLSRRHHPASGNCPQKSKGEGEGRYLERCAVYRGLSLATGLTKKYNFTWELESKANHSNVSKAPTFKANVSIAQTCKPYEVIFKNPVFL